jgi:DNA topoisomerase-3
MKLVIGEKPSAAKAYADVLGAKSKKDGYYEGNGYVVSWCVGHLLGLAEPAAYNESYAKWRKEDLPISPTNWKYVATASTKKQLKVLVDLMKRSDVDLIINGADAGREGELIFRLVYEHAKCKKPTKRLWVSSMEEVALREGFNNLRPGADYDSLYQAAKCRQQADWLVGMNYSRLFSIVYNANLRVGRVQTPTLAMVVERFEKINNFTKEPFYVVELSGAGFTAERERLADKELAYEIANKLNGITAVIRSIKKQDKSIAPPRLYALTTLQREANKMFGLTASKTLEIVQGL